MRYFITLAYQGTHYCGWQRQPNDPSVQATLETALTTILRQPIALTGCGRTDTGVHAQYYVAHFDAAGALPVSFLRGLNSLLPDDIAVYSIQAMHDDAHARFDAHLRAYEYHLSLRKDPFHTATTWAYPQASKFDLQQLQAAAAILPQYQDFAPFCKSDSGLDHFKCTISEAHWDWNPEAQKLVFHISANRFLRGMVRLIVGACAQVASGQLSVYDIRLALDTQTPLRKSLSVPPQGLFLTKVVYPYPVEQ